MALYLETTLCSLDVLRKKIFCSNLFALISTDEKDASVRNSSCSVHIHSIDRSQSHFLNTHNSQFTVTWDLILWTVTVFPFSSVCLSKYEISQRWWAPRELKRESIVGDNGLQVSVWYRMGKSNCIRFSHRILLITIDSGAMHTHKDTSLGSCLRCDKLWIVAVAQY